jgi:hypothetical protein
MIDSVYCRQAVRKLRDYPTVKKKWRKCMGIETTASRIIINNKGML